MAHDDDIDRILAEEDEIVPSAAFAASVMEAVRREALVPPPIPFPWKRAAPGLAAAGIALALAAFQALTAGAAPPTQFLRWLSVLSRLLAAAFAAGGHWVLLALLLTYASVRLSSSLTRLASPVRG